MERLTVRQLAVLPSDKVNFRTRKVTREKDRTVVLLRGHLTKKI